VVHRDIKPANLLVDGRGNLWITDFGLARFHSEAGLTLSGDLVGTLRYMSPEQALAKREMVDHRTDVYSLGVTLYELLTLQPAFTGRDREELLRQIASEESRLPRQVNRAIPADLETIVLKAMSKDLEGRYTTAQDLANDLRRFLDDKPIQAKRPSPWQRLRKWARRHRAVVVATAVATAVVGLLAVVGLIVSNVLITRERTQVTRERTQAEENLEVFQKSLDEITTQLVDKRLFRDPQENKDDRELVSKLLRSYEEFVEHNRANPRVRHATALAYLRIGNLYWL